MDDPYRDERAGLLARIASLERELAQAREETRRALERLRRPLWRRPWAILLYVLAVTGTLLRLLARH